MLGNTPAAFDLSPYQYVEERPIIDGFVHSASMLYLPTTYRASALAQMELLRRANVYRPRQWCVPETLEQPVEAYSQMEYQARVQTGSYLWGLSFSAPFAEVEEASSFIHIQITNACTETALFSDYIRGDQLEPQPGNGRRHPFLLPQPLLILDPALINIELYNSAEEDITCQLVLFLAEPAVLPRNVAMELEAMGVIQRK